jgi:hypothetical protein
VPQAAVGGRRRQRDEPAGPRLVFVEHRRDHRPCQVRHSPHTGFEQRVPVTVVGLPQGFPARDDGGRGDGGVDPAELLLRDGDGAAQGIAVPDVRDDVAHLAGPRLDE